MTYLIANRNFIANNYVRDTNKYVQNNVARQNDFCLENFPFSARLTQFETREPHSYH